MYFRNLEGEYEMMEDKREKIVPNTYVKNYFILRKLY